MMKNLISFLKTFLAILMLLAIGLAAFGLTLRGAPGNPQGSEVRDNLDQSTRPFELSPERGRYALVSSLAEYGTFALQGEWGKAAEPDVGYYQGRSYIYFAPGVSILALPFHLWFKNFNLAQVGTYATVSVVAILNLITLYFVGNLILKLPRLIAIWSAMMFAFGTVAWSYAITLYQHHFTTWLILSSLLAAWYFRQGKRFGWLGAAWVGMAYGLGIWLDYPNAILLSPVVIYLLCGAVNWHQIGSTITIKLKPSVLIAAFTVSVFIGLLGYYNYTQFGNWKRLSGSLTGFKQLQAQQQTLNPETTGVTTSPEVQKDLSNFFKEENLPHGLYILIVSINRGFLFYSPVLLFGLWGLWQAVRKNASAEHLVLLFSFTINLLLYASWGDPWGGWAYGPRYLIPGMAILSLYLGFWAFRAKYQLTSKFIVSLLWSYSLAVSLLGALTTNTLPPDVEAVYLKMPISYIYNLRFLFDNHSSSFAYNFVFFKSWPLIYYYLAIYYPILIIGLLMLFLNKSYIKEKVK